jgi:hypothetical protein
MLIYHLTALSCLHYAARKQVILNDLRDAYNAKRMGCGYVHDRNLWGIGMSYGKP